MTLLTFNIYAFKPTENLFELGSSATCAVPSYLSKSKISKSNSIVIGWDQISQGPKKYELLVVPRGQRPILENTVLTSFSFSNNITIFGLNENEFFDAYVRSVCDSSKSLVSNWSEKIQFRTDASDNESNLVDQEKSLADALKIYPNPATSKFKLQGPDVDIIESVSYTHLTLPTTPYV